MDHEQTFRILATVFKKEAEISRKIYTVHNTQQLLNQTCDAGHQIDRLMKFSADFAEFIDVDPTVSISDLDKFHIYLCESTNSQAETTTVNVVQVSVPFCKSFLHWPTRVLHFYLDATVAATIRL